MPATPFRVDVPQEALDDLRRRLENTRWVEDFANTDWRYGANVAYIKELTAYWLDEYDWRATEAAINAFDNYQTEIDGLTLHYLHARGKGPAPMPLFLNHGWPWTFWDYKKVIGPLTDPAAHGGDPADAFEIVAPSLPGFAYSSPLRRTGIDVPAVANLWVKLMDQLGHRRFGTQGADAGSGVSFQLGHAHAERVIGVHSQLIVPIGALSGEQGSKKSDFAPDEQHLIAKNMNFADEESGYSKIQATKPMTPAVGLSDSPVGLLAWIVEKRRNWSDCGGDVEAVFSKAELIDTVMIYWLTNTYGTSARWYWERKHNPWVPAHDRWPRVEAPTACIVFPGEVVLPAKSWAERYFNLQRWSVQPAGGHFGAMEQPKALVEDLREFFRPLRNRT